MRDRNNLNDTFILPNYFKFCKIFLSKFLFFDLLEVWKRPGGISSALPVDPGRAFKSLAGL